MPSPEHTRRCSNRLITPSQLALFSRSPRIGAWWEELHAIDPQRAPRPATAPLDALLFEAGLEHETVLIAQLKASGRSVAELRGRQEEDDYAATVAAMRSGVDFIWQASLRNSEMRGAADLLERIEEPSALGDWSYIPIECKLSSHPRPIYLVQACAYCELLEPILGARPTHFSLYLGGQRFQRYAMADVGSWYEQLRCRYRDFRAGFDPGVEPEDAPGDHGLWDAFIQQRLEDRRDLILVAGMRTAQRDRLRSAGIHTLDQLATWQAEHPVHGLDSAVLLRLRDQARIQLASERSPNGAPAFEVRPLSQQERGLAMLPAPDRGDIWFDMEGFPDPIRGEKLEYLFGACYRDPAGERRFIAWWAHDEQGEREAFDGFMRWVQQRREDHPDLHVYHYASYEKTALGNLASRHQLHQPLWDQWLREELFVDLYPIVRHGLLLGAPSYSIKKVEGLHLSQARQEEVTTAADSVVQYAEWIKSGEPRRPGRGSGESARLQDLEDYNRKDCESTQELHGYLLQLPIWRELCHRPNRWDGVPVEPEAEPGTVFERDLELAARCLREEIPEPLDDPSAIGRRGLSWAHQKLLAQLVDFQEREGKVEWWEFFNRINGMSAEEREDDTEVIAAATRDGAPQQITSQSRGYRYRFSAEQPLKLAARAGQQLRFAIAPLLRQPGGELTPQDIVRRSDGKAFDLDGVLDAEDPCGITLKLSGRRLRELQGLGHDDLPAICDLIPLPRQIYKRMLPDLVRQAQAWVNARQPLPAAMQHLLERRAIPELRDLNTAIRLKPEDTAAELAAFLASADGLALSLQGPPGTGKTTVTGALIARLVQQGQRVAVSSQGHEAINNLLKRTQSQIEALGGRGLVVKLSSSTSEAGDQRSLRDSTVQALRESAISQEPDVLGATVFSLVKESYADAPFDLLVIDEAGQMSLSNLLYMSQCARNILLVGDQQQLSQPNRARHPGDSGLSCLDYVMNGQPVVPPDRGVFLATSWRMPPVLTDVVSELFYEGELQGSRRNAANRVLWDGPEQGLLFQPVAHEANGSASDEEVEAIATLVERLLERPFSRMRFRDGAFQCEERALTPDDILITAPYNLQVNRLQRRLGQRARIGTVDRFQGQEAPVAIHSLTASDGESAPRGLAFVLDPNRLNVAISRAQCLCIVVGSARLATGISTSVEGVRQLNRLCRLMAPDCPSVAMERSA